MWTKFVWMNEGPGSRSNDDGTEVAQFRAGEYARQYVILVDQPDFLFVVHNGDAIEKDTLCIAYHKEA